MKKTLLFGVLLLWLLPQACLGGNPTAIDWKLKFFLNDETLPFFADTVRHTFVSAAMMHISGKCKYAATARDTAYIVGTGNQTSIVWQGNPGVLTVTEILGVKLRDSHYSLSRIRKKDIGLGKIATDQAAQYYYIVSWGPIRPGIGVYNQVSGYTPVDIYYSGIANWDSCRAFKPFFENEAALYALYLAKQRQGETEIANFILQIATNEINDLKAILENRPMDITVKKEVVPR